MSLEGWFTSYDNFVLGYQPLARLGRTSFWCRGWWVGVKIWSLDRASKINCQNDLKWKMRIWRDPDADVILYISHGLTRGLSRCDAQSWEIFLGRVLIMHTRLQGVCYPKLCLAATTTLSRAIRAWAIWLGVESLREGACPFILQVYRRLSSYRQITLRAPWLSSGLSEWGGGERSEGYYFSSKEREKH